MTIGNYVVCYVFMLKNFGKFVCLDILSYLPIPIIYVRISDYCTEYYSNVA